MSSNSKSGYNLARHCFELALVFLAYLVAGEVGLSSPFTSGNVSPVWPASGIALASILILGFRVAPAILLAAFAVNFGPIPTVAAAGLAIGNTGAALLGAFLLTRIPGFDRSLSRLRDVLALIVYAAIASPLISASVGVTVLYATHVSPWSAVPNAWFVYWFGDAIGIVLVAPLFLTYQNLAKIRGVRRVTESALLLALLAGVCSLIFTDRMHSPVPELFAFAVFPFVIWAAMRFGVTGVALANLVIANVAISATFFRYGPFAERSAFVNASLLQIYIGVLSVSGLLLAATVSEREQLVEERAASGARLRLAAIVESSEDAIIGLTTDGTITSWNSGAERLYGYSQAEMIGKPLAQLIPADHGDDIGELSSALVSGTPLQQFESVRQRKDGRRVDVSLTLSPIRDFERKIIGVAEISRDITQQKLTDEALRRADRLATAGRLAASIAHEINNPLESLTNLIYLIERHPSLDETARLYAHSAEEELKRTAYITRQMLSFHRGSDKPVPVDLGRLLDGVIELYAPAIQKWSIVVKKRYETQAAIVGIPNELKQVFANLVRNAIEAVGHHGTIQVRVHETRDWNQSGRRGVRVIIADNGRGISKEVQNKVFDPFFTTKGESGTGLGLWVGLGIIQKRSGSIRFRSSSTSGRSGTVFSIFLPFEMEGIAANHVQAAD